MDTLQLHLRDISSTLVTAWRRAFMAAPEVEISCGDIFELERPFDAIVSPANSFGFMDGGIDAIYSKRFGWDLQDRLQAKLRRELDGECPIGQAVIIETNHPQIPLCISAPTMRVPEPVHHTVNAYLALRAALRAAKADPRIKTVLCPGLGTAVGRMSDDRCAVQMYAAYEVVVLGQTLAPRTWPESVQLHQRLLV